MNKAAMGIDNEMLLGNASARQYWQVFLEKRQTRISNLWIELKASNLEKWPEVM